MLKFISERKNQLIIIVSLTLLAYLIIFRNQFVVDDKTFILDWQVKNSLGAIGAFFKGAVPQGHEGVYRPLRSVFYALDWQIFGSSPFGYHLQSILVHLAASVLVYFIVWEITRKKFTAFFAGTLFGLHPIHTETITYIASSMDAIGIVFFLASFYLFLKASGKKKDWEKFYIASVVLAALAYFTAEVTLTLPLLIIAFELCFKKLSLNNLSKRFLIYIPHISLAVIYLLIRFFLVHAAARGPYLADSPYLTALTMTKVFLKYLNLTVLPFGQAANHVISKGIEAFVYRDYRTAAIRAQSILNLDILLAVFVISALIVIAILALKKRPVLSLGIAWFFIALLPVAELVPQGSMMNERFLYLPSFGLILILAHFLNLLFESKYKTVAIVLVLSISASYLVLTLARNRDWHDEITLWSRDIERYPDDNAYAYFQLGNAYNSLKVPDLALTNYQRSYEINPAFVVALASIGKVYEDNGKHDLAIGFYRKALEVNPRFWEAHNNLANIYFRRGDFDLASSEYQQILASMPNFTAIEENLKNMPGLKEATQAAGPSDEKVWLRYHKLGLSFVMPSKWLLSAGYNNLIVTDDKHEFSVNISLDKKERNLSYEDYLKKQKDSLGSLTNEGLAQIPNFEKAYVRVWSTKSQPEKTQSGSPDTSSGQANTKLEFFLFKDDKVVKLLVYPAESPQMKVFDLILGSVVT